MDKHLKEYWQNRLIQVRDELEANRFTAHIAPTSGAAKKLILEEIIPTLSPRSVSYGGSLTLQGMGIPEAMRELPDLEIVDTYDFSLAPAEALERRRQSLLVDLYFTGTNAVTEEGQLVNVDGLGNRVAAITFGPRNVLVLVGRNKIVPDLEGAIGRIQNLAAPVNAKRLNKKTPCVETMVCMDCASPDRICNHLVVTEKTRPPGRIIVVLVNEDLGY